MLSHTGWRKARFGISFANGVKLKCFQAKVNYFEYCKFIFPRFTYHTLQAVPYTEDRSTTDHFRL